MEVRKSLTATAEVDPPRHHRYPTRWKLRCHSPHSSLSSHPQDKAIVTPLVPCKRNLISQDKAIVIPLPPSKRNKRLKSSLYLPTEIIFNILLFVPAKVLHQVATYVCKQWNDIVNDPRFIKAHCQLSSAGLLVQNPLDPHQVYYIEGDNSTEIAFPFHTRIYGSFNGLVLFHDLNNLDILSVINPVTKVKISLPPVHGLNRWSFSIAFAISSSGHYKVVVALRDEGHCPKTQVMVFTIGIDKAWRFIDLQGNSEMESITLCAPRFIAGMLYWCNQSDPCFAMDVDTETVYLFHKPDDFAHLLRRGWFLSLGACLGLLQQNNGIWKCWKLIDVKSGEWTELDGINKSEVLSTVNIELYPKYCCSCMPVMLIGDLFWFYYVVDGEFVVIRFNLANESFVFFPIKAVYPFTRLLHHVQTLLSPKKCYP